MADPQQTVEDLGKLVKKKYPGPYDAIPDAELGAKVKAKYPQYSQFADMPEPAKKEEKKPTGLRLRDAPGLLSAGAGLVTRLATPAAKGAAKGAASTALNLGELAASGATGLDVKPLTTKARQAIKPQGPAEEGGFRAEQLGEFLTPIPGLGALKVAKAPGFLNLGARMLTGAGREALDIGLKTGVQTGSPTEGAKAAPLGAAFGAAGPVLESFAPFLRRSAEKGYAQVLAPGTKADKFLTANKLLNDQGKDLLNRRVMALTESGLKRTIAEKLGASTVELEDAWQKLGTAHQHNLMPVINGLQQDALRAATEEVGPGQFPTPGLGNRRIVDPALYDAYQEAALDLIERLGPQADEASAFSMRKVRQLLDNAVKTSFAGAELTGVQKQAKRAATDAIRNVLNKENPEIGEINKAYSFWRTAEDVFDNTQLRRVGQRRTLSTLARWTGRAVGGAAGLHYGGVEKGVEAAVLGGYLAGKFEDVLTSTAWKTVSAVTKNDIANLLVGGKAEEALNLAARAVGGGARLGWGRTPPTSPTSAPGAPPARPTAAAPGLKQEVRQALVDASARQGVPLPLLTAVARNESAGNRTAVSPKGAQGVMQLMPETARQYGVRDPFDAKQNIEAGARHLRYLLDKYHGDYRLALAAYNAGEKPVDQYGGVPPYPETQEYVRRAMSQLQPNR